MAEESIIKYGNVIGSDNTFKVLNDELDTLEARVLSLAKATKGQFSVISPTDSKKIEEYENKIIELEQSLKLLAKQKEVVKKAQKEEVKVTQDQLVQIQAEKLARAEQVKIAKLQAVVLKEETNTIKSLRAQLSLTTLQWSKLTDEETKSTKAGMQLVKEKLKLTNQLKALEKQTGDTRRNVGNYTDSIGTLGKVAARVFVGRNIVDGLRRISSFVVKLIEDNKEANKSLQDIDSSFNKVGSAITQAGLKLLNVFAPAIIFVADGLANLLNFLSGNVEGMKEFSATSDELKETTKGLNSEFTKEISNANQVFTALKSANVGSKERKQIIDQINTQYGTYLPNLLTEKSTLQDIEAAQRLVNEQLTKNFLLKIQQATQLDVITNKSKAQIDSFDALRKRLEANGITIKGDLLPAYNTLLERLRDTDGVGNNASLALTALKFNVEKFTDEIAKTDPKLAELLLKIREISESKRIALVDDLKIASQETGKYNDVITDTQSSINALAEGLNKFDRSTKASTDSTKDNSKALEDNAAIRIKAIQDIQDQIEKAEIDNIKDRQEKLLALEDLRAKEERKQRQSSYAELAKLVKDQEDALIQLEGKNSKKVEDFKKSSRNLLLLIEKDFDKLEEEQLKASEQRKLDIRKQFFEENVRQQAKLLEDSNKEVEKQNQLLLDKTTSDLKKQQDEIEASYNYRDRKAKESAEKQKELNSEVFQSISENSQKIGELIVATFEKQADVAKENVQKQSEALENARQRAQDGLSNNIKFEKEQLVQREAEQLRAEKRKQNAAKLTALFNLVASAAASGDKDAVISSIVQFGLLEGFAAAIEGSFFEGSEDIGKAKNPLDANGGRLILAHDNERIVTAKQNKELNGMSNKDLVKNAKLGERISDLYPMSEQLNAAHFAQQSKALTEASRKTDNNAFGAIERGLQEVKRAIINKPTQSDDLVKVSEVAVEVLRKTVSGQMTKTEKIKKYI